MVFFVETLGSPASFQKPWAPAGRNSDSLPASQQAKFVSELHASEFLSKLFCMYVSDIYSCRTYPSKHQGQKSAQGILRLRNPNSGPNSVKRILDARILHPNSWVEFFDSVFSSKRGPLKNSPSRNSPPKIHLPKFDPEIGPNNSHCTSAVPFG